MDSLDAHLINDLNFRSITDYSGQRDPCYEGDLLISEGLTVRLHLRFVDKAFGYPIIKLVNWQHDPTLREQFSHNHIRSDGLICHTDSSQSWWDSSDCIASFGDVIERTEEILKENFAHPDNSDAISKDFSGYWGSTQQYYLASTFQENALYFERAGSINSDEASSSMIWLDAKDRPVNWLTSHTKTSSIWLSILLSGAPNIKKSHWPPQTLKQTLLWLEELDSQYPNKIINAIANKLLVKKNRRDFGDSLRIALAWSHCDVIIGFRISLSDNAKQALYSRRRSSALRLIKNDITPIDRYQIIRADPKTIHTRKLPEQTSSLIGKSIVLIGAGAIGGQLAPQLCAMGAGANQGCLTVIDHDKLNVLNIGRHYLGMNSIEDYKSVALCNHLHTLYPHLKIKPIAKSLAKVTQKLLAGCDLIVDATGDMNAAISLHQRFKGKTKRPAIFHSWIQGRGLATASFYSPPQHACFRCLWHIEKGELVSKYPVAKNPEDEILELAGCHNSFMPYSIAAAAIAAAQTTERIGHWLADDIDHNLSFRIIREKLCHKRKDTNPQISLNCPICSSQLVS